MKSGNGGRGKEVLSVQEVKVWLKSAPQAGQKLADGGGLYLTALPSGNAAWQYRYRLSGKQKVFSIGPEAEVSLADARGARNKAKELVDQGLDPGIEKRARKIENEAAGETTFKDIAGDWLAKEQPAWSEVHYKKSSRALARDVYPALGKLPVARITTSMVAAVIEKVQKRGVRDTAQKLLQHVRAVFRFAQARGLRPDNPAEPVIELLQRSPEQRHHPALLALHELGDILRRAEVCNITTAVRLCHRLIAFTAVRVANAVEARWEHFDLDSTPAVWSIPRAEMKVGKGRSHPHRVVLPEQIARDLRRWKTAQQSSTSPYLFPGNQGRKHLSRESVEKALRETLGLAGKHSPHGWRSAFSTRVREDGDFDKQLIDLCLDHVHDSDVARAYDRGDRLEKRVALMQWWGDQLEQAERGGEVVAFPSPARSAA